MGIPGDQHRSPARPSTPCPPSLAPGPLPAPPDPKSHLDKQRVQEVPPCRCARHGPARLCSAPAALMGLGDCQLGPPCHLLAAPSRQPPRACSWALPSDSWPWASLPRARPSLGRPRPEQVAWT